MGGSTGDVAWLFGWVLHEIGGRGEGGGLNAVSQPSVVFREDGVCAEVGVCGVSGLRGRNSFTSAEASSLKVSKAWKLTFSCVT